MNFYFTPYILPLAFSALVMLHLSTHVWKRRNAPGAMPLIILLLAIAEWTAAYCLELMETDLHTKQFWAQVEYFGIVIIPLAWVYFAIQFSGKEQTRVHRPWVAAALLSIPLLTLIMIWAPPLHHLIWREHHLEQSGVFLAFQTQWGAGFWVFTGYAYLLLAYGSYLLLKKAFRSYHHDRQQVIAVLIAVFIPWLGNLIYLTRLSPWPGVDLSSFGFAISGATLAWAILNQNMMELLPIARTVVVENLELAMIVLDEHERIVDLNPSACALFSVKERHLIGKPFTHLRKTWPELSKAFEDNETNESQRIIQREENGDQAWFALRHSTLREDSGQPLGQLITLLDITGEQKTKNNLQKRVHELTTLHAIAQAGLEAENEDTLIEKATQLIGENLFSEYFGVLLVDEKKKVLVMHSTYFTAGEEGDVEIPLGQGITGQAALNGETRYVPDVSTTPEDYIPGLPNVRSELCVPIKAGKRVLGVINVESALAHAFSPSNIRLMETLASQLATALERLRSQHLERQQAERLARSNALIEALSSVTTKMMTTHDPDQVLAILGSELATLNFHCLVSLSEPGGQELAFRYTSLPEESIRRFERISGQKMTEFRFAPDEMSLWDTSVKDIHMMNLREGFTVLAQIFPGFTEEHMARIFGQVEGLQRARIVHLPLQARGEHLGVLWLMGENLEKSDLPALAIFTKQTAGALENARLYAAVRQRSQELEALRQASLSLTSTLELPEVLKTILSHAVQLLEAGNASIFLYDGESLSSGAALWANGREREMPSPRDTGVTYQVARDGKPVIIPDVNQHPMYQDWQWGGAMVSQPLRIGKEVRGVMNIALDFPHQFSPEELRTLQLLADQAALALENARLFNETQHLAITDGLTGIHNRRHAFSLAQTEFDRSQRFQRSLAAIMIDVDHFKKINDTHGHTVGDNVLATIAHRLQENIRSIDILGRYGGEEFAVILPETYLSGAREIAERLRASMADKLFHTEAGPLKITISLGVAALSDNTPTLGSLITRADENLLRAKEEGRNRVEW